MMYHTYPYTIGLGIPTWPLISIGFLVLMVWTIFWKGLALWHSAQRGQPWWFGIMLIVNTAGILEIIYLFGIAKLHISELFTNRHPR